MTGFAKHCISGQIAALKENLILGLFGCDSSPELNTTKLDNSIRFPSVTYTSPSDQWFRSYEILRIDKTVGTV
jgi:hypothetical protein